MSKVVESGPEGRGPLLESNVYYYLIDKKSERWKIRMSYHHNHGGDNEREEKKGVLFSLPYIAVLPQHDDGPKGLTYKTVGSHNLLLNS